MYDLVGGGGARCEMKAISFHSEASSTHSITNFKSIYLHFTLLDVFKWIICNLVRLDGVKREARLLQDKCEGGKANKKTEFRKRFRGRKF